MLYSAKTVEDAIQLALDELGVTRSELDIEVINEPKQFVFGLVTSFAEIKVRVKDKIKPETFYPEVQGGHANQTGLVSVSDGKVEFVPPQEGGLAPRLLFDNTIEVYYNGKKANNHVTLEHGLDSLEIIIPEDRPPSKDISIDVSEDKLEAVLRCRRISGVTRKLRNIKPAHTIQLLLDQKTIPVSKITLTEIKKAVEELGLGYGINYHLITEDLLNQFEFEVMIAQGKPPVQPTDAQIEYLFQQNGQRNVDLEADRIDHLELNVIPNAEKGEIIARKLPAAEGQDGIDVFGKTISVRNPRDYELRAGEGTSLSADKLTVYAEQPGRPVIHNGEVRILKMYEINGDVSLATGNIRFNGEVIVRGNVAEQLKIEAFNGGVQVYGMVTQAQVQAARDIVISRNAISSRISAGGNGITYLKLSSYLHELFNQISSLLTAFNTVIKASGDTNHGRLLKNLMEIKYTKLPKDIQRFDQMFTEDKHTLENGLLLLMNNMKAVLLGRGPLELSDISTVEIIRSDLAYWRSFYQTASTEVADITVSYLQNSTLEASGIVRVIGQGAYYSSIIAGQGYYQPRGVFRGGEIAIEEGNIQAKEIGGPTGIGTVASIVKNGKMSFGLVHPNVTVLIANHRFRFERPTSSVRVFLVNDGLEIVAGSSSSLVQ